MTSSDMNRTKEKGNEEERESKHEEKMTEEWWNVLRRKEKANVENKKLMKNKQKRFNRVSYSKLCLKMYMDSLKYSHLIDWKGLSDYVRCVYVEKFWTISYLLKQFK